jgi:hypothetical protein
MGAIDPDSSRTPHEAAKEWALALLDDLGPDDSVAVLQAKQQVVPIVGELSLDLDRAREKIRNLPDPAGGADWPAAMKQAHALLATSKKSNRDLIVLGDGQRHGWADPDTLFRWELLANELGLKNAEPSGEKPRLWVVNVYPDRQVQPPNWSLTPLVGNRPVVPVEREVTFRTDLVLSGASNFTPPHRLRLEVDGKVVRDLPPPRTTKLENGKIPFSFAHRFATPGSHLVSLILQADPPLEERPRGYVLKDRVPGDNRQDFAVEVVASLPVLLVDGDPSATPPPHRGTDFMRDALAPSRDRTPVVKARVVPFAEFTPALLKAEPTPRVLILCNLARFSPDQLEAIDQFLANGGGVLVTLGDRPEADFYNESLYHGGEGWLPAGLEGIEGKEEKPGDAAKPDPATLTHPTLDLFRKIAVGGLGEARFPRWWKLATPGKHAPGAVVGSLRSPTASFPFLVERAFKAGRVMLSAVPMDNSWGSNLTDLPAFVPLVHELVYHLAGARSADFNLASGQPIRYRLDTAEVDLSAWKLQPPGGEVLPLSNKPGEKNTLFAQVVPQEKGALLVHEGARETGVYRLTKPGGDVTYYVVPPDARESDLTPCSEEDRSRVASVVPGLRYENDRGAMIEEMKSENQRQDFWMYFLLGLIALLCMEVWMTRRMVMSRA